MSRLTGIQVQVEALELSNEIIRKLRNRLKLAESVLDDIDFKTLEMDKELNTKYITYLKGKR